MLIKLSLFALLFWYTLLNFSYATMVLKEPEPLDEKIYYSDTKKFSLKVTPSSRHGKGSAEYTFFKKGKVQWNKSLAFTLRDVKITSIGIIAGYSYSQGFYGYGGSKLSLWLLDQQGKILYSSDILRNIPPPFHSPDYPYCNGIVLHEVLNEVIFRIYPESQEKSNREKWIVVSLESFKEKEPITFAESKQEFSLHFDGVLPIPNRSFFIAFNKTWSSVSSQATDRGSYVKLAGTLFRIINHQGNFVWVDYNSDDIDHEVLGIEEEHLKAFFEHNDIFGIGPKPGEFWISYLKDDKKIKYKIAKNNKVEVVSQEKLNWRNVHGDKKLDKQGTAFVYHNEPKYIKSFQIGKEFKPGDLPERIIYFDFDQQNNMGSIALHNGVYYFYLISQDNEVIAWKELDRKDWGDFLDPSSLKKWVEDKWLLLLSNFDDNPRLLVLSSMGEVESEIKLDFPGGGRMIVHPNGRISILSIAGDKIKQYDVTGKSLWTFYEYYGSSDNDMGELLSPEDIALTPNSELVVLDNIAQHVNFYSSQGKFLKTIDFKQTKSGEINYPTFIAASHDGIIYVKESAGSHKIHKYSREGEWLGSMRVQHADGRPITYIDEMQFDKENQLWFADKAACRLNKKGIVAKCLGEPFAEGIIRNISVMDTDSKGNLYVYDSESSSIFSYGLNGEQAGVFKILSWEENEDLRCLPEGRMFIDTNDYINVSVGSNFYDQFDANGKKVSRMTVNNKDCLISESVGATVLQSDKVQKILKVGKGYDGKWFRTILGIYTDYLGQMLFYDYVDYQKQKIHIFDASGKSLSSFSLMDKWEDFSHLQLNGKYIYFTYSDLNIIRVTDLYGKEIALFPSSENSPRDFSKPYAIHADVEHKKLYVSDSKKKIHVFELLLQ